MMEPEAEESLFEAPPMGEQERMVEAILFASAEPVTLAELAARMPHGADPAEALVFCDQLFERRHERGQHLLRVVVVLGLADRGQHRAVALAGHSGAGRRHGRAAGGLH